MLAPDARRQDRTLRIAALLGLVLVLLRYADTVRRAPGSFGDFKSYYHAAEALRDGRDIYGEGQAFLAARSFAYWKEHDPYVYPPLLAALLVPLTWLGEKPAALAWLVLMSLSLAAFVLLALRVLVAPADRPASAVPAVLVVAACVPLLLGIQIGQVDPALLAATTAAFALYLGGRDLLAGVVLGLAAAIKPTLAFYGLFFLRKRRFVTLAAAVVTGLGFGLGPFLLLGRDAFSSWLALSSYYSSADFASFPVNQSLRGWLVRVLAGGPMHDPLLAAPGLAGPLWIAAVAAVLVLCFRLVSGSREAPRRSALEYALTATAMLFCSPLSEDIHYTALLFALVVLIERVSAGEAGGGGVDALALAGCLYFAQPWLNFAYYHGGRGLAGLVLSGTYLYGLVLVGAAIATALALERASRKPAA